MCVKYPLFVKNTICACIPAIGSLYSDGGLLGAMVVCEASAAGKIVSAVAAALRSASVTEAEVAAAKKNLLADVYAVQGSAASLLEDIGTQVSSRINIKELSRQF
jgi:predicted Zn-dependent peptidase